MSGNNIAKTNWVKIIGTKRFDIYLLSNGVLSENISELGFWFRDHYESRERMN